MDLSQATDKNALLQALRDLGADVRNERAMKCPIHGGKHTNAGIFQSREDGKWRFKCHSAPCADRPAMDAIDLIAWGKRQTPADVIRQASMPHTVSAASQNTSGNSAGAMPLAKPVVYETFDALKAAVAASAERNGQTVEAIYEYRNPQGNNLDLVVWRLRSNGSKSFRQGQQTGGGFVLCAPDVRPIYNRGRIAKSDRVVVVEGEKCVHALHAIGIVATTSPGGSNAAHKADWSPLAGRLVIIWRDNDDAGQKYEQAVIDELKKLSPAVRIKVVAADHLGLPKDGSDCVDFLEEPEISKGTLAEKKTAVEAVLEFAEELSEGAVKEFWQELDAEVAGQRRPIRLPWEQLHRATKMLRPRKVIMLAGHEGATKSFFLLALFAHLVRAGIMCALMMLEDDKNDHFHRVAAQAAGDSHLTDPEYIEGKPELVAALKEKHGSFIADFDKALHTFPTGEITVEYLTGWIRERCAAGARVIAIDPITAMAVGREQWVGDLKFLIAAKQIVGEYGASLILVTHPKTGAKTSLLHDMAGGGAYRRFCHTCVWLERVDDGKRGLFEREQGTHQAEYNRLMRIRKARDSFGAGMTVGFQFDPKTFAFNELGFFCEDIDE